MQVEVYFPRGRGRRSIRLESIPLGMDLLAGSSDELDDSLDSMVIARIDTRVAGVIGKWNRRHEPICTIFGEETRKAFAK